MSWSNPNSPNLPDFTLFVSGSMDISPLIISPTSPFLGYAFNQAVNLVIATPCSCPPSGGIDYTLAVYNCAGHILIKITPDQTGRTDLAQMRKDFGLIKGSAGVVQSTGDDGTSVSLAVPDAIKSLTIGDLQFMLTPWGRDYLSYAQDFGGIWGLS